MDSLLGYLESWKPFTALVVGDLMLDEHLYGDAERLSADAPVPILHVRRKEHRPGGAANVCLDLVALKGKVIAVGVVGDDEAGKLLRRELREQGVSDEGIEVDSTRPTTIKQNLVGLAQARHPQKMFRIDFESREPIVGEVAKRVLDKVRSLIDRVDVLCIEDYSKGVCTEEVCQGVIRIARDAGKEVLVDPAKIATYAKYRGATSMTPNRTEAEFATGLRTHGDGSAEHNTLLAKRLVKEAELETAIITLDRHGALLLEKGKEALAVPTVARKVYDVTGAGDMMLAALAAARANKIDWPDAVRFANAAAGLEVEVFGVQPIPLEQVHHAVLQLSSGEGKLRTLGQLLVEVAARRRAGQKIVFTNGCFDVLHAGHVALLDQASKHGDFLIVGINEDASVRRLKGDGRPVNNQEDRAKVLSSLGSVGSVVFFGDDTPIKLIEAIKPDVLVKGGDYTKNKVVGHEIVEKQGGRVVLIDLVEGRSTTNTIKKMQSSKP
ncbi:MAG: D-glycero-beta-D-manno-heptose 1-phosphate adenylyltransferase [Phycisphaeraceae bacterium]|nr:D-glycero-beta-D-manno-heptose 1-phosphate adenylyltransferase [Phycisphaeraceae bacterium]